jgi:hypothetical protein
MFAYVGGPLLRELGSDHPELRLRQIMGFMASLALQRRFDRSCLLVPLSIDQLVELVAPTVRHLATAPIPPAVAAAAVPGEEWATSAAPAAPVPDAVPAAAGKVAR